MATRLAPSARTAAAAAPGVLDVLDVAGLVVWRLRVWANDAVDTINETQIATINFFILDSYRSQLSQACATPSVSVKPVRSPTVSEGQWRLIQFQHSWARPPPRAVLTQCRSELCTSNV